MKQIFILLFSVFLIVLAQSCKQEVMKLACIGDSITEGDGLSDRPNEAYPAILAEELGDMYKVMNLGQSGATLLKNGDYPYREKTAFKNALVFEPDIVTIFLGTNDSKSQNIPSHPGEFLNDLRAMVNEFQALPSKPIIYLCKPIPAFKNRFHIDDSVLQTEVLPAIEKVATEKNCKIIDLHSAFADKTELIPDGVHPNKDGAREIAIYIAKSIKK